MTCPYCFQYPTAEEFAREVGGEHWVVARRSKRIVERYGMTVICLSPKQYDEAQRRALLKRTEGYD